MIRRNTTHTNLSKCDRDGKKHMESSFDWRLRAKNDLIKTLYIGELICSQPNCQHPNQMNFFSKLLFKSRNAKLFIGIEWWRCWAHCFDGGTINSKQKHQQWKSVGARDITFFRVRIDRQLKWKTLSILLISISSNSIHKIYARQQITNWLIFSMWFGRNTMKYNVECGEMSKMIAMMWKFLNKSREKQRIKI